MARHEFNPHQLGERPVSVLLFSARWPIRLTVRTRPSQGRDTSSILVWATNCLQIHSWGRVLTQPSQGGFLEARLRRGAPGRRDTSSILGYQLFNRRSPDGRVQGPESKVDFRLG